MLRICPGLCFVEQVYLFTVVSVLLMRVDSHVQTFKDHMIDGETLPLLSEEHLLDTLGLKLGPALKIRSQVKKVWKVTTM